MLGSSFTFANSSILQDVESLSEDVIDYALENDVTKVNETLGQIEQALPQIFSAYVVSSETQQNIQSNFEQMKILAQDTDLNAFIVSDNQLFSQFIDLMYDNEQSVVPKAVIELDYLGRELQFQPKVKDWVATQKAIDQTIQKWTQLKPQIQEKGLKDLIDSTLEGLLETLQSKNQDELFYRGQLILDEVDLLEWYFEGTQSEWVVINNSDETDEESDIDEDDGDQEDEDDNDENDNNEENDWEEYDDYLGVGGVSWLVGLVLGMLIMWLIKRKK